MHTLIAVLIAAAGLIAAPGQAQKPDEPPSVTTTELRDGLYLLRGRGGNVLASVGASGVLIIDDDFSEYATAYADALEQLAGSAVTPRFVLNSHWHGDHTGGNKFWGERGAVIVAQANVRQRLATRQERTTPDRVVEPSAAAALPVVTYADALALHFNGDDLEVQHYPRGHTDGDSVVFFAGANVVHLGDHFFKDRFPFVDIDSGGNAFGYIANVKAVLGRLDANTIVIPGHGALADRADLERFLDMLTTTSALITRKLEAGMSVDAIAEEGLGEQWQSWGSGYIDEPRWIKIVAESRDPA